MFPVAGSCSRLWLRSQPLHWHAKPLIAHLRGNAGGSADRTVSMSHNHVANGNSVQVSHTGLWICSCGMHGDRRVHGNQRLQSPTVLSCSIQRLIDWTLGRLRP